MPWIDPAKEAKAWRELVDAKLESRKEVMRQRGRDPAKVVEEMSEERNKHQENFDPLLQHKKLFAWRNLLFGLSFFHAVI